MRVQASSFLLSIAFGVACAVAGCSSSSPDTNAHRDVSNIRGLSGCPGADTRYPATAGRVHGKRTHAIKAIVIHALTGWFDSTVTDMWQHNTDNPGTAAHYVVSRAGKIAQAVSDDYVAYHVRGVGFFEKGASNNDVTIGIEHEDAVRDANGKTLTYEDNDAWCTDAQYHASARLAAWLARRYAIPVDAQHIVGHVDVPDNTHGDPGKGWRMDEYISLVQAELAQAQDSPCADDATNAPSQGGSDPTQPDPVPSGGDDGSDPAPSGGSGGQDPAPDCSNDGVAMPSGWYDASLVGIPCANDGTCNPCADGSGLMCGEDGTCGPGCRSDANCHGADTCDPDAQECFR
jgi:N-acetyl-anhydromuramyl-L-alanine amidase AmpD